MSEIETLRGEVRDLREDLAEQTLTNGRGRDQGSVARIVAFVTIAAALVAIAGQVYANGRSAADTEGRLNRNCRILAAIQADERFIIIQHASEGSKADLSQAEAFREIFRNSAISGCGG